VASEVKGDRALRFGDEDKLGFRQVAKRIAASLLDHGSDSGLVIGIEGAWGSGKSSLLFLIEDELGQHSDAQKATVINFRPWLIGNRDTLIADLFGALRKEIDRVAYQAGDPTGAAATKAKEAGEALRKFAVGMARAGALFEFVGEASSAGIVKLAGSGLKALGEATQEKPEEAPLDALKDRLITSLRDLKHRFIVAIDDVDRLEPSEVIEVLRLTRSVADFPNVIYLLCYDSKILSNSIEKAAQVSNGLTYLEKIVQLTVMVPTPETFQLRQWFGDDLRKIAETKNDDELSRLKEVIDYEGGRQLRTPRSVVRALDSIRFFWPPLREVKADLPDVVWLQLIKDGNPDLYRWIETYCTTAAAISLGTARVEEAERAAELEALKQCVASTYFEDLVYRYQFAEHLPGLKVDFEGGPTTFALYDEVSEDTRDTAIRNARLTSPDHYRLYFALGGPSHALTQADIRALRAATERNIEETTDLILNWHKRSSGSSFGKLDLLLERMRGGLNESLTIAQCQNVLIALANSMDEAYRIRPFDRGWVNSVWDRAEHLIPILMARLTPDTRLPTLEAMFKGGLAISWLTTLLRRETFAHGRYGTRRRPQESWFFSEAELDRVIELMLSRYRRMAPADLFKTVDPLSLLFAWRQTGDESSPKQLVTRHAMTSEGLIEVLKGLTSTVVSSNRGKYLVLSRDNLAPFLDYNEARQRIGVLADEQGIESLRTSARDLAKAFDDSED
jgi:hypothetical protein